MQRNQTVKIAKLQIGAGLAGRGYLFAGVGAIAIAGSISSWSSAPARDRGMTDSIRSPKWKSDVEPLGFDAQFARMSTITRKMANSTGPKAVTAPLTETIRIAPDMPKSGLSLPLQVAANVTRLPRFTVPSSADKDIGYTVSAIPALTTEALSASESKVSLYSAVEAVAPVDSREIEGRPISELASGLLAASEGLNIFPVTASSAVQSPSSGFEILPDTEQNLIDNADGPGVSLLLDQNIAIDSNKLSLVAESVQLTTQQFGMLNIRKDGGSDGARELEKLPPTAPRAPEESLLKNEALGRLPTMGISPEPVFQEGEKEEIVQYVTRALHDRAATHRGIGRSNKALARNKKEQHVTARPTQVSRYVRTAAGIGFEVPAVINGRSLGMIPLAIINENNLSVRLRDVIELISPLMDAESYHRYAGSGAAGAFVTLNELRKTGLYIRFSDSDELIISAK